jgi:signal transduction histidine kinase
MAAEPGRVLLIYNSVGYAELVTRNIRADLQRRSPKLLETYDVPIPAARVAEESVSARYADYLRALFPDQRLELAVAIGSPAMEFFRDHGPHIFPSAPMLAIVEQNRAPSNLERNETIITSYLDLVGAVENILQLLPETTNISVVIGTSPLEQYWLAKERLAFQPFAGRISFRWLNDLSFDEIIRHAATLPRRSAILFNSLFSDVSGGAYEDSEVVSKLHAVAKAPIFSFDISNLGQGIVGGPWPSTDEVSRGYADVALRIIAGEALAGLTIPGIVKGPPKFDWREMQRWGISEDRLPPGSEVRFRPASIWEQYRLQMTAGLALLLLQTGLIGWLVIEHQRRRTAEVESRLRMSELTQMNRRATATELSVSISHEIRQPLAAMVTNANAGWLFLAKDTPDVGEAQEALKSIVSDGHRADQIIGTLRAMFKKEGDERASFDVNLLIQEVIALIHGDLHQLKIEVRTELAHNLPQIYGNRIQLQQVILNLAVNAKDAMGSVADRARVLRVSSKPHNPNGVVILVQDSGTGIEAKKIDNIFAALYTTKPDGMGMGLAICRSIIEGHGGKLSAMPGHPHGAVFRVVLPIGKPSHEMEERR